MRHTYRHHLNRGRRLWDLGARAHRPEGWMGRQQRAQWDLAVTALALEPGETVLDFGCGAGGAFPALRHAVGSRGHVVGLDYSPRMLALAGAVVAEHHWDNVEVRRGDASSTVLEPGRYDAAVAGYALSAVPDLGTAVQHLHAAIRPGGRVFVGDMQFGPHPAARLLRTGYRMLTGADAGDVPAALRQRFDTVEPVTDDAGRSLALPPGRSWPPISYVLARRSPEPLPTDNGAAAADRTGPGC